MNRMKQTVRLTSATLIIITGGDNMTWSTKPGGEEQYLCTAAGNGSTAYLKLICQEFIRKAVGNDEKVLR